MGFLGGSDKTLKKRFVKLSKQYIKELKKPDRKIEIVPHHAALEHEVKQFRKEVSLSGSKALLPKGTPKKDILLARVSEFDSLIERHGLERGSTILLSGGCGCGKTTFCLQSLYYGALNNEKGVYICLEEDANKVKKHALNNFGWNFSELEKKGLIAFLKLDPIEIARNVEALILKQKEKLVIEITALELPFKPDRIVVDSLSALAIAFENTDSYRKYIRYLFEKFEAYETINFVISETEQEPKVYSRAGIEEFLADGVIVLYNIKMSNVRQQALEILKLRSSNHQKKIVPFEITNQGIKIYPDDEIFKGT
ncbi:hypothetical protein KKE06_02865 [Candidatus Micrarchaeota archaeon]|nr:hypothetical protein [Candidatus Micrarchaeota archaeon]MBU1929937.1 hypothetical protein [Candidatus Micrarchaeota archaeon]